MRGISRIAVSLIASWGFLVACSQDPAAVTEPEFTEAEVPRELGVDSVVVGKVLYSCSSWKGLEPPAGRIIIDLIFGRAGPKAPPDRPLEEQLNAVKEFGGRILHVFNFPAVRADIQSSAIPVLYRTTSLNHARSVPYSDRFDWPVMVGYREPPTQEDLGRFTELGGRLTHVFSFPMIAGDLPDSSFPELRADPTVVFVEAESLACVGG